MRVEFIQFEEYFVALPTEVSLILCFVGASEIVFGLLLHLNCLEGCLSRTVVTISLVEATFSNYWRSGVVSQVDLQLFLRPFNTN